jgi:hypothetical protein
MTKSLFHQSISASKAKIEQLNTEVSGAKNVVEMKDKGKNMPASHLMIQPLPLFRM